MKPPRSYNLNPPGGIKNQLSGFTLLEILVAIAIFAVVVTTIFGSYRFIFSNTDVFDGSTAGFESARSCLNRMTADLQAAYVTYPPVYPPPDADKTPDPYRFFGETVAVGNTSFPRLRFTSLAHIPFEKSRQEGIAEIVYYVQPGDNETFTLRRADTLYPYKPFREKGADPVLCESLKSLAFTYYHTDGAEYDYWDSDEEDFKFATPRAVGIRLEIGNGSYSQRYTTLVQLPVHRLKRE